MMGFIRTWVQARYSSTVEGNKNRIRRIILVGMKVGFLAGSCLSLVKTLAVSFVLLATAVLD